MVATSFTTAAAAGLVATEVAAATLAGTGFAVEAGADCLHERRSMYAPAIATMRAAPPRAPPTMAPRGGDESVADGGGAVLTVDAPGALRAVGRVASTLTVARETAEPKDDCRAELLRMSGTTLAAITEDKAAVSVEPWPTAAATAGDLATAAALRSTSTV